MSLGRTRAVSPPLKRAAMSTSPPPAPASSPTQVDMTRVSKTAAQHAAALLLYVGHRLSASAPGAPGADQNIGVLAFACALAALAASTTAFAVGGRDETVRAGLETLSALARALAYAVLVAEQCLVHPETLGVAMLVAITLGGGIAAVSCYGRYADFWEVIKASVRSWVGAQPLPDLERGEA